MLSEIIKVLVDDRLCKAFFDNAEYIQLTEDENKAIDFFSENMSLEQRQNLSHVLDVKNAASAKCCSIAYEQGWRDCMELMLDLVTAQR